MKNRRKIKSKLSPDVHLMNKNEARVLRQIKSKTGLSEKEIRNIKEYRILLSDAQDKGERMLTYNEKRQKYLNGIFKIFTRKLKLAKEHPNVKQAVKDYLEIQKSFGYCRFTYEKI